MGKEKQGNKGRREEKALGIILEKEEEGRKKMEEGRKTSRKIMEKEKEGKEKKAGGKKNFWKNPGRGKGMRREAFGKAAAQEFLGFQSSGFLLVLGRDIPKIPLHANPSQPLE